MTSRKHKEGVLVTVNKSRNRMNLGGHLTGLLQQWPQCWALHGPHLQHLLPGLKEMSGWTLVNITCRCVYSSRG